MQFTYIGNQSKKDVRLAGSFANGAFVTANSAASFANGAFVTANSAASFANGSFTTANSAASFANGSFEQANSGASFANGAFGQANSAASFANGAFVRANSSYGVANSGSSFANGAFTTANSAASFANGAFVRANSSYGVANSGASFANGAFTQANTGTSIANSAFDHANAAFQAANTGNGIISGGSGSAISLNVDRFTANGATTTFNLSVLPTSNTYTTVVVDGIVQQKNTYTVSGGVITFDSTFENGANIEVTSTILSTTSFVTRTFTGDGTTNNFTISYNTTANSILVFDNGITQNPLTDYSVSGNTILFVEAPANGSIIQVRELAPVVNLTLTSDSTIANVAFDRANLAYAQANAAFNQANNSTDTWVRTQANNAYDTANSAGSFANAAFITANSSANFANGAFDRANSSYGVANSGSSFANGAFTVANTADGKATSAGSFANGAFVTANSAASFANGAFTTANSAASFANGAFTTANLKFNSTGGTISGDVNISGNLSVTGNTFSTSATQIVANDTLFIMGTGNYSGDVLDIGFTAHYNNGTNAHTGLIRDAGTKEWQLFEEYTPEVGANNNIIITDSSFKIATLNANLKSTTITIKNIDVLPYVNNAYDKANSGASFANGAFEQANSAASFANGAFLRANASYTAQNTTASFANGAFEQANSGASFANGAFTKANNALANTTGTFNGELSITGKLSLIASSGDEGGELFLAQPQSNNTLSGGVTIDVYQNKLRFFEQGGSARGAFIDLSAASGGVGSDLLSGGGGGTIDTTARTSAQAAFDKANSAGSFANGAFTKANNALANTTGTFNGDLSVTGVFKSLNSVGSEGGEIQLSTAASGTTLTAGTVTIDVYGDTVRIFETGGTNRGAYINLAAAGTGVSTNLMSSSGGTGADTYARDTANAAYIHANSAFDQANTGGTSLSKAIAMSIVFGF